jgi:hypothetical protein
VDELLAFWREQLDETEAYQWDVHRSDCATAGPISFPCDCGYPARVLREVAADRAILAEYVAVRKLQGLTGTKKDGYRDWILRQRVAVYSDHPSYKEEWKP